MASGSKSERPPVVFRDSPTSQFARQQPVRLCCRECLSILCLSLTLAHHPWISFRVRRVRRLETRARHSRAPQAPIGRFRIETTSRKRHSRCLPQRVAPGLSSEFRPIARSIRSRIAGSISLAPSNFGEGASCTWRAGLSQLAQPPSPRMARRTEHESGQNERDCVGTMF